MSPRCCSEHVGCCHGEERAQEMTPRQEAHLQAIKDEFAAEIDPKFRQGAHEHGGDLLDLSASLLIDEALQEANDIQVYLRTLRQKVALLEAEVARLRGEGQP